MTTQTKEQPGEISFQDKAVFVENLFDRIAPSYDQLNDFISFGMHRAWKDKACQKLNLKPGSRVLDVCTGTGDLIHNLRSAVGSSGQVTGLDFSKEMLVVAKERFSRFSNINLVQGDALNLPFEDAQFDGAVVAFGLRNVTDISLAIQEMVRVVKPGGWVVNLDTNPEVKFPGFKWYFRHVMPRMGQLFAKDKQSYQYLFQSTESFLPPEKLAVLFEQAGMSQVSTLPVGFGSAAIIAGQVQSRR
jgi:demethylmenaquinone methyltransferase/2-methoxy-6-polyprenyl-1,4-benzoquinol methylase